MTKKIRALALFSGGLDSALAIKIVKDQGIEVIALNFVSHFFGGSNEKAEKMAKQLGVQLEYVHFEERHTKIVSDPVYGRGKNMNPCIDCHALMFKVAGELLEKYNADFIISGEVLGQRPMSQNFQALEKVKKLSGIGNLVLRPLSAKLLPESDAELKGLVDRSKLLDIQGRSRQRQIELTEKYGIIDYPTPGGGCLLTDPGYSNRLKIIEDDGFLKEEYSYLFDIIKVSRFFRIDKGKYIFVGRDKETNDKIKEMKDKIINKTYIHSYKTPGPNIISNVKLNSDEINFAKELFSRYSKNKGIEKIQLCVDNKIEEVESIDIKLLEEKIKQFQI